MDQAGRETVMAQFSDIRQAQAPQLSPLPQGVTNSGQLQNLMALMQASQQQRTPQGLESKPSVTSAPATTGNTTPRTTLPVKSTQTSIQKNPAMQYRGPQLSRQSLAKIYGGGNAPV
jgi:hypothetical protein